MVCIFFSPDEVAVIDEIQLIGDLQRGWSWTRALLGLAAKEIHVCGEETAIDLVEQLALSTGDELEVGRTKVTGRGGLDTFPQQEWRKKIFSFFV